MRRAIVEGWAERLVENTEQGGDWSYWDSCSIFATEQLSVTLSIAAQDLRMTFKEADDEATFVAFYAGSESDDASKEIEKELSKAFLIASPMHRRTPAGHWMISCLSNACEHML